MNAGLGDKLVVSNTDNMVNSFSVEEQQGSSTSDTTSVTWDVCKGSEYNKGMRIKIAHDHDVNQVTWHGKGDYFAVALPKGGGMSVFIHQLSKRRSQNPFKKIKGLVQKVEFHPIRPFFFVAVSVFIWSFSKNNFMYIKYIYFRVVKYNEYI